MIELSRTVGSALRIGIVVVACAVVMLLGLAPRAMADTMYTYTGPTYSLCGGTYIADCSSTSLSGTLVTTLTLAQLENGGLGLSEEELTPAEIASISFSDTEGTSLNKSAASVNVAISTDASGDITSWLVLLSSVDPIANDTVQGTVLATRAPPIGTAFALSGTGIELVCGASDCALVIPNSADAGVNGTLDGSWSAPVTVTPEPSSLLMLGAGLMAVWAISLRRKALIAA